MPRRPLLSLTLLLSVSLSAALGCDGGGEAKKNEGSIAKALDMRAELDTTKTDAEFDKEYEAKKKAEEAAKRAQLDAALEGVAVMPESPVKGHKQACNDVADAYDEMVKRRWADDAKQLMMYYDRRRAERAEVREKCRLNTSAESANCYAHALRVIDGELYEHTSDIMRRCVTKFGGAGDLAHG